MVAVVVVLILSVLGVGLVRLATSETAGALAGARREALAQCAEAGRQLLMSKFHLLGGSPVQITPLNFVPLDGPAAKARTFAVGGHIDTANVTVSQVVLLPPTTMGAYNSGSGDLTNKIVPAGVGGGVPYKVMVHCQEGGSTADPTSGRQLEIEFGINYGL
jgi:type II secretory pathway pseudopilin PulG